MTKSRLYPLVLLLVMGGYMWVAFNYFANTSGTYCSPEVCLFKNITGIPCPSCGATRSVVTLLRGDFTNSLFLNPLGIILLLIMTVSPVWIIMDLIRRKETFLLSYVKIEVLLRQKWMAISFASFIVLNWIWNIHKNI